MGFECSIHTVWFIAISLFLRITLGSSLTFPNKSNLQIFKYGLKVSVNARTCNEPRELRRRCYLLFISVLSSIAFLYHNIVISMNKNLQSTIETSIFFPLDRTDCRSLLQHLAKMFLQCLPQHSHSCFPTYL